MAFGYGYPAYQPPMYQPPNPMPYQQQINSMPPQYQQAAQQTVQSPLQQQVQGQPNVICRPVASEEEARAVPTDFTGATLVLTDTAHGKIYTKSLNYADGSAMFATYQLVQPQQAAPVQEPPAVEYAPRSELESLRAEIDSLRAELEETKKTTSAVNKKPAAKGAES